MSFNAGAKIKKDYDRYFVPYKLPKIKKELKLKKMKFKSVFFKLEKLMLKEVNKELEYDFDKKFVELLCKKSEKKIEKIVEEVFFFIREKCWKDFNFDKKNNIRYSIQFEKKEKEISKEKNKQLMNIMNHKLKIGKLSKDSEWYSKLVSSKKEEKKEVEVKKKTFEKDKLINVPSEEKEKEINLKPTVERKIVKSNNFKFDSKEE